MTSDLVFLLPLVTVTIGAILLMLLSAFEKIRSLPPGHLMVVTPGATRIERYWDWRFPERDDEHLNATSRPRLQALGNVGALLRFAVRPTPALAEAAQ